MISACTLGPSKGVGSGERGLAGLFSSRQIASRDRDCMLVKHPQENIYQVRVDGRPHSEFWYDLAYGERLLQRLRDDGTCVE
jgi:hypothetical protein